MAEASRRRDASVLLGPRKSAVPLRKAMLVEGVDLMRTGGFTSLSHGEAELDITVNAFDRALERLQLESVV